MRVQFAVAVAIALVATNAFADTPKVTTAQSNVSASYNQTLDQIAQNLRRTAQPPATSSAPSRNTAYQAARLRAQN